MGSFERGGTFQDRPRFLAALKQKIAKLKEGALRGMTESWEEKGPAATATLSGFGVSVAFEVREADWSCRAEIPSWLPIPQASIEEKFDREFSDLKGL